VRRVALLRCVGQRLQRTLSLSHLRTPTTLPRSVITWIEEGLFLYLPLQPNQLLYLVFFHFYYYRALFHEVSPFYALK
jgi:hypothetical protein